MDGSMLGFLIWLACGLLLFGIGIRCLFAKKQVGFWANAETPPVENIRAYNRAVGVLWLVYAAVFCALGLPMLLPQPSAAVLLSVIGVVLETIALIAVYLRIEENYRKK